MLKGYTKIELTDVHTGEKEVVEKHNIVTNAINNMFKSYGIYFPALLGNATPYRNIDIKSCCGGLITWDGNIDEDENNCYFKPYGVNAGAHAACDIVNTGTDNLLGSYNSTESKIEGKSAKFVYDFATNQGNGVISCITLVSQGLGAAGFSEFNRNNPKMSTRSPVIENKLNGMIPLPSENKLIKIDKLLGTDRKTTITIEEYKALLTNSFSLFLLTTPEKMSEKTFSASELCDYINPALAEGNYLPIYFDKDTNTISIVLLESGTKVSEVTIATINILTKTVTKRKVNIEPFNTTGINAFHYKDYLLYFISESEVSILDLNTGAVNDKKISISTSNTTTRRQICPLNDHEFLLWHDYEYISAYPRLLVNLKDGECKEIGTARSDTFSVGYSFYPDQNNSLYFATINNLETPVTKTADKIMKITYTITEE